ncbi:hypothetical protein D3C71_1575010 [compost metagenome]
MDVRGTAFGVVRDGAGAIGQGAVAADVIGQHQGVAAHAVAEVVVAAFELQEARDEVEVALAVLDDVGPLAVGAGELVFDGEPVLAQHLLDDVGRFLELEDFEITAARGVPQPGAQYAFVEVEVAVAPDVGELRHLPGDEPLASACLLRGEVHLDAHVLAQQAFGGDGGALADQPHPELEQPRHLLGPLQRAKFQLFAQWAVNHKGAV